MEMTAVVVHIMIKSIVVVALIKKVCFCISLTRERVQILRFRNLYSFYAFNG